MAEKIQFYIIDITYKIVEGKARIYLFGRTSEGKHICAIDDGYKPYFYTILENEDDAELFCEKVSKLNVETKFGKAIVTGTEITEKNLIGNKVKAVKIFVNLPTGVPVIKDIIKDWELVKSVNEYDIKFTRKYLTDKKIIPLTLVEFEGNAISTKSKVPCFKVDNIVQADSKIMPSSKIMAFDIEVYNPQGKNFFPEKYPIIMIAFYSKDFKKVITWKKFKTDKDYIEFVEGEVDLINRFKEIIEHQSPDILTGYFSDGFDFPYIIERAKKYNIRLDLGLDHSEIKQGREKEKSIHITGMIHLDVFKFIRKILGRSLDTDSYSLDNVSKELLNEQKDEVDLDNLAQSWDKNENLEEFCSYNLKDSELTFRLCEKVFPNISEMVKIVGLPVADINRMGFSQLVENYIMRQAVEFNELYPNKPNYQQIGSRMDAGYEGAFVFKPEPGLYKDIVIFDFRSLYPSILISHNIGLSTLNCECCKDSEHVPGEKEFYFCKKKKGFIPSIVKDLILRRMRVKDIIKKEEGKNHFLEARSNTLKLLANSFYGYLGFYAARWYCLECAKSITAYGRYYIEKVIREAEENNFKVIYSDTDSVFLTLDNMEKEDAYKFVEKMNSKFPEMMELEYEGYYPTGIFVSAKEGQFGAKKKYALIDEKGMIKIKGFETVRRNWSLIAKEVQEKVLEIILKENDKEKALDYVHSVIKDIEDKKVDYSKMIISTQLKKEISGYDSIGPHVQVAKNMEQKGIKISAGMVIKYIIGEGTGIIRDRALIAEDVIENNYDAKYYIEHQVVPSVERIFNVLGYKKEDLIEKEQSKLDRFF